MQGIIRTRRHSYGFIALENETDRKKDYFFHETDMARGEVFLELKKDDLVEFKIEESDRGLKATQVRKIKNDT